MEIKNKIILKIKGLMHKARQTPDKLDECCDECCDEYDKNKIIADKKVRMEQFSLENYLKNPNREVVTRNGLNVHIICTNRIGRCPVVGLVNDGYETLVMVTKDGCELDINNKSDYDLFFKPN